MYQIHVESAKNPNVYRVYQVFSNQTLFDLEFVIASGFNELGVLNSKYEVKRRSGVAAKDVIYTFPEDDRALDTNEELLCDWLVQLGKKKMYCIAN